MESIDDIEDFYQREIETLDREFFDNFKKNKNKELIVKTYRQKLTLLRKNYEKKYKRYLDIQKVQIQKNKEKILSSRNIISKKNLTYEVKRLNLDEIGKIQDKISRRDMFNFRLEMKFRKIYHKMPNSLVVFIIKSKYLFKRTSNSIIKVFIGVLDFFKEKTMATISWIKETSISLFNKIKKSLLAIPKIIIKIIPKKKTSENVEPKKEDNKETKPE